MSNLVGKTSWRDLVPESAPLGAAQREETEDVFLGTGTVTGAREDAIVVRVGDAELRAMVATSCLVVPQAGDRVLVAMPEGECYVLAVLRREAGAVRRIATDGDLELSAPKGKVVVASGEGIDLLTPKETSVVTGNLNLHAGDATAVLERLSYLGTAVRAEVGKLRVVAAELDGLFERSLQRIKRAYRFVEEIDQTRARQIDVTAETSVRVHAGNTVMTADELVKIDGSQVHIG